MAEIDTQLKQAYRLIKTGDKQRALKILTPIISADFENYNAWWLFANATDNKSQKIRALENVIRLKPDHTKASMMLDKLLPEDEDPFDDLFESDDDPFDDIPSAPRYNYGQYHDDDDDDLDDFVMGSRPRQVVVTKSTNNNPIVVVLAIIGFVVIAGCGLCMVTIFTGAGAFGSVIEDILENVTVESNGGNFSFENSVVEDAIYRGSIERGQTVSGNVDTFDDDRWTFYAEAGSNITFELNASSDVLDPQLYVYDSSGNLIDENDDIDLGADNLNSRLQLILPRTDTYTIVVSAFGSGGPYELTVRSTAR